MMIRKIKIRRKIFLGGGGSSRDSFLLDKEFVNSLEKKNILYIPIALNRDKLGFEACYDWIIATLSQHSKDFVNILMILNLSDKDIDLSKYDAIYIGGGDTYKLLHVFYTSGFNNLLKSFIDKGGIVYGGSAGAIILGKNINIVSEENINNYNYEKGLSIIGDYSIICHYNGNKDKKIKEYVSKYKNSVISIPENSGLFINGNVAKVIGKSPIFIFNQENELIDKKPNEEFIIE